MKIRKNQYVGVRGRKALFFVQMLWAMCVLPVFAGSVPEGEEAEYILMRNGDLWVFPDKYVDKKETGDGEFSVKTIDGQSFVYALSDVVSFSHTLELEMPSITSFKFNNKFNDQVFTDAEGEIGEDGIIRVKVAGIGKWLTPSFQLSDKLAEVYVEGKQQNSKESRLRFDHPITYTVGYPQWHILSVSSEENPDVLEMRPFGRDYVVQVDFLTDHSTNVPRIDINTENGEMISSKEYYLDATITIDGAGVFPSMGATQVKIKGRGNTTWSGRPTLKNPYRLKFSEKVKPLGMKKGKNWVLLANRMEGSMLTNAIGLKVANLVQTAALNHIVPVELYINGGYRGSYNFTEKVGLANNSIELEDESHAVLLELDTNYDEAEEQKFRSTPYDLPVQVKDPDFSDGETELTLAMVQEQFNAFLVALEQGDDISPYVDIEQLARYLMVGEYLCNVEYSNPRSVFCYRENILDASSPLVFGPVWDCDYNYGYNDRHRYFMERVTYDFYAPNHQKAKAFIKDLREKNEAVDRLTYFLWKDFLGDKLSELLDFCQDYYDYAKPSLLHDKERWVGVTDYAQQVKTAQSWLAWRAEFLFQGLTVYEEEEEGLAGDVNGDGSVDISDVTCLVNIILGRADDTYSRADVNGDGSVNISDVTSLVNVILGDGQVYPSSKKRNNLFIETK
ncbi:MAG: CotH kinase family protein [Bacteroidaceae bacterium]|nr:CotH kinase family protein [Bacteroidaceae bacterium]